MKQDQVYRRFWLSTKDFGSPPRFGLDWFLSAIDVVWEKKTISMDWDDMEAFLVDVLKSQIIVDREKVRLCKEGINAFTRRGHFDLQTADTVLANALAGVVDHAPTEVDLLPPDVGEDGTIRFEGDGKYPPCFDEDQPVTLQSFAFATSQLKLAGINFSQEQSLAIFAKLQSLADEATDRGYDSLPGAVEDRRTSEAAHARRNRGRDHQEEL
jgi:hypothetical protein